MTPNPPEERLGAYLMLQQLAMVFVRNNSENLPREQLRDLADALHNLPEFILPGLWSDAEFRRLYLEPYDRKSAHSPESPSLIRMLEDHLSL